MKARYIRTRSLRANPQLKANVLQVRIQTPRKPNSARRGICKGLTFLKHSLLFYIPFGQHSLKKHSNSLVRGGGARDLPGVYTTGVRGVYDLKPPAFKKKKRSLYGIKLK